MGKGRDNRGVSSQRQGMIKKAWRLPARTGSALLSVRTDWAAVLWATDKGRKWVFSENGERNRAFTFIIECRAAFQFTQHESNEFQATQVYENIRTIENTHKLPHRLDHGEKVDHAHVLLVSCVCLFWLQGNGLKLLHIFRYSVGGTPRVAERLCEIVLTFLVKDLKRSWQDLCVQKITCKAKFCNLFYTSNTWDWKY